MKELVLRRRTAYFVCQTVEIDPETVMQQLQVKEHTNKNGKPAFTIVNKAWPEAWGPRPTLKQLFPLGPKTREFFKAREPEPPVEPPIE